MTLRVPIQASVNGNLYQCIAKDFMGHIATSQAGKLSVTSAASTLSEFDPEFTLVNEPDDYYGRIGDTATFIVEAEGANLSYQWLYRAPGANNFEYLTSSDATTNTLRVEMTAANNGGEFRCFITDANGDMGSTRIATIKLDILDWNMEYNTSGIRTKRASEELTYNYIYAGDKLMRMTVGDDILDFSYDTNGTPLTMTYNGTVYYYITNLQGDVISLEQANGSSGATYAYDAWGNIIAMMGNLAEINPLRYRGYVYDQETGFYYLNSRYYDPAVGRFINADSNTPTGQGILGHNAFAYCGNSPIARVDATGELWVAVLGAVGVQYASDLLSNIVQGKTGIDIFVPTSSLATYTAVAVTALIPGGTIMSAVIRSTVSESIQWVDNTLRGRSEHNSVKQSLQNIAVNTLIDVSTGKLMDSTFGTMGSRDFTTYSKSKILNKSATTLQQTYTSMQRSNAIGRAIGKTMIKLFETFISFITR